MCARVDAGFVFFLSAHSLSTSKPPQQRQSKAPSSWTTPLRQTPKGAPHRQYRTCANPSPAAACAGQTMMTSACYCVTVATPPTTFTAWSRHCELCQKAAGFAQVRRVDVLTYRPARALLLDSCPHCEPIQDVQRLRQPVTRPLTPTQKVCVFHGALTAT